MSFWLCCAALCTPQVLKKGDVLMEFDGVPIANDGTVPFRARERIFFTAFTTLKPTGSTARVKVSGCGQTSKVWEGCKGFGGCRMTVHLLHCMHYT